MLDSFTIALQTTPTITVFLQDCQTPCDFCRSFAPKGTPSAAGASLRRFRRPLKAPMTGLASALGSYNNV
eukprot:2503908-Rhodomonas_salina.1